MIHDFCLSVMLGLFQNSLESSLSMSALPVHLCMLGVRVARFSKMFILSNFMICFSRNLTGPLFGVSNIEGHTSFW